MCRAPRSASRSPALPPRMPLLNPAYQSSAPRTGPALPNLPDLPAAHDERTLRIALVTEYYYPHLGGVCEHVHFFAREARRRGHRVDIITSNLPGAGPQPAGVRERVAGAHHRRARFAERDAQDPARGAVRRRARPLAPHADPAAA